MAEVEALSAHDAAELGATDSELFYAYFFPATFRQDSPQFAEEMNRVLDDSSHREAAFMCFRGSGKTTRVRAFAAKRISYAVSRTIMLVSKSQEHSLRSLRWLKRQIDKNKVWTETFGLERGDKWTDEEITIVHGVYGITITVIAVGVRGQTRGLNIDDYRPDLIVVDDPNDAENTNTPEQRQKTAEEFFGSLHKSLAPRSEAPLAKMVLLQTPFHEEDLIHTCRTFSWPLVSISCFNGEGESVWPARFPTEELQEEKDRHIEAGMASTWYREMECTLVGKETAAFRQDWLRFYDPGQEPDKGITVFGIDPASADSKNADKQALAIVRVWRGEIWVLEALGEKGEMPDAFAERFFALTGRYRAAHGASEGIGYQRVLAWYLAREMRRRLQFRTVHEIKGERRRKEDRIPQVLRPVASQYALHVRRDQTELIDQFTRYPDCAHDDLLDALAIAVEYAFSLGGDIFEHDADVLTDERDIPELEYRSAP